MESSHFDRLVRAFGALRTRRAAVTLLGGMVAVPALGADQSEAKHKKHKKPCKAPKQKCGGKCVAIQTDERNCGACGNACASKQSCTDGQCTGGGNDCQAGTCCHDNDPCQDDGRCRDGQCYPKPDCRSNGETFPESDGTHCCSENLACDAGTSGIVCTCGQGELGNDCLVDGDCKSNSCVGYQCVGCPLVECDGQCVSLDTDANCGACGRVCELSKYCHFQRCQPRYELDTTWPLGELNEVFVDSDDTMFVIDFFQHCVRQYSSTGVLQYTYGVCLTAGSDNQHLSHPQAVVAGPSLVFIVDQDNNRIQVFARNGGWLGRIGNGQGSGNYEFNGPKDIAVDADGNYYVADSGNYRVQKYDSNGTYVRTFGGVQGSGDGQFNGGVLAVAVDRDGNVYVGDKLNFRVQKFDREGHYLRSFGSPGSDPGQMGSPWEIAVASNGDLFIADPDNVRVQQFTKQGQLVRVFDQPPVSSPPGVALDLQDNLYIADEDNGIVRFALLAPEPSSLARDQQAQASGASSTQHRKSTQRRKRHQKHHR